MQKGAVVLATLTAIFSAQDKLSGALSKAGQQGSKLQKVFDKMGSVGAAAMKGIITSVTATSTALVALGKNVVDAGMAYETSMSQVMATMGITQDTMFETSSGEMANAYDMLSAAAKEMGASTAFSTSEAADALNYLALAGYDAEQAVAALPTVLHLAGAGGMELATASDMITDSMAALQMEVNQTNLETFADQMAKTASTTNTSVSQLGEAILTVGATAANLAGGTTELNTQLGVLANVGIKGAEGGTHLRNVLLRLQSPTDKAAKQMKQLGVEVYDTDGKMRSTNDIFVDLKKSMDGMSQSKIDQVMATIFNKTDIAAANALLASSGDEYERIFGIIENSGGAAAEMYETMLDNLDGDVAKFNSATEALYLELYDAVEDTLRELVQLGTDYIGRLQEAFNEGGFEGLAEEIGAVLADAVTELLDRLPALLDIGTNVILSLVNSISENADKIALAAVRIGIELIRSIFKIAPALGSAFISIVGSAAQALIEGIPELLSAVPDSLYGALGLDKDKIVEKAGAFGEDFKAALSSFAEKIKEGDILGAVSGLGVTVLNAISSAIGLAENTSILDNITERIKGALDPEKVKTALGSLTDLGEAIIGVVASAITLVVNGVSTLATAVTDILKAALTPENITSTLGSLSDIGDAVIGLIGDAIKAAQNAATSIYTAIGDLISSIDFEKAGVEIGTFVTGLINKIAAKIAEMDFETVANALGSLIGKGINGIKSAALGIGQALSNWILSGEVFTTLYNIVKALVSAAWGFFSGLFTEIWDSSWLGERVNEFLYGYDIDLAYDPDIEFHYDDAYLDMAAMNLLNSFNNKIAEYEHDGFGDPIAIQQEFEVEALIAKLTDPYGNYGLSDDQIKELMDSGLFDYIQGALNAQFGETPVEVDVPLETSATAYNPEEMALQAQEAVSSAITTAAENAPDLTACGIETATSLANGITDSSELVSSAITSVSDTITTTVGAIDLYSTGQNVVQGLANGMDSMVGTLMARAQNIANRLKATIQSGLEVHSPSRFTDWVGQMLGEGLANGLNATAGAAYAAADAMAASVAAAYGGLAPAAPTLNDSASAGQTPGSGGGGMTIEKRIVIDLQGSGMLEVTGMNRESAIDLLSEQLMPMLKQALADEIYEGGDDVYEF